MGDGKPAVGGKHLVDDNRGNCCDLEAYIDKGCVIVPATDDNYCEHWNILQVHGYGGAESIGLVSQIVGTETNIGIAY